MSVTLKVEPGAVLPRQKAGVVTRALGSRLVLYHPDTREVSVLNATAAAVWELCDGTTSASDAVARLRTRFRVEESRDLACDVAAVLSTLSQRGLVEVPTSPAMGESIG